MNSQDHQVNNEGINMREMSTIAIQITKKADWFHG